MKNHVLTAFIGIAVALVAGLLILWLQGYPALSCYYNLLSYSALSQFSICSTLNKVTPLMLTGLSAAVGFGSGAVNLGQVGQFLIGAIAAAAFGIAFDLPAPIMVLLSIAFAIAAGAAWSGVAALLRRRFNMDEFITTLMLNFIADYYTQYLISGPMMDPSAYSPMTRMTHPSAWLPAYGGLSASFFVAIAAFVVTAIIWNRSKLGYEWRVMGQNPVFARVGGCRIEHDYTLAMLLSGALAGLAGGLMVIGGMQHRFVKGIGADYAWDGVMIAMVAANDMVATGLYALFFAALQTGAMGMEMETQVPSEFILVLQAITVLFVVASRESTQMLLDQARARVKARTAQVAQDPQCVQTREGDGTKGGGIHASGN